MVISPATSTSPTLAVKPTWIGDRASSSLALSAAAVSVWIGCSSLVEWPAEAGAGVTVWVGVVGVAGVGAGVALWAGAGRRVGVWAGVAAFAWVDAEWCGGVASWRRGPGMTSFWPTARSEWASIPEASAILWYWAPSP